MAPGVASDGGRDTRISLDSCRPTQAGQPPAPRSAILIGCMGIRETRKADWSHGARQPQTKLSKKTSFKTGMLECPEGLSASLQDIKDSRKTAVINDELKSLNVDIATLQETRLADSGTLKEKDYTFFWQGKLSNEPREHGVGFSVRNSLLRMVEPGSGGSERLLTLRLNSTTGPVCPNTVRHTTHKRYALR